MKVTCISRIGRLCIGLLLWWGSLQGGNAIWAQWTFLGPQWLATDSVSSQAIALNDHWQVHVATLVQGGAHLQRFDGVNWVPVGSGLPSAGLATCAFTFEENRPWLALGPALALYTLDNGFWHPISGLPFATQASDIQLRVGHDHAHWLAWTQAGAFDSVFVATDHGGPTWSVEGAFSGRVVDLELNEDEEPVLLLDGASALLRFQNGNWTTLPTFYHTQQRYVALAMTQDGTGTGAVVLRRDSTQAQSVELLSNGNWVQLGAIGFTQGDQADLQVDLAGVIHVLSVDNAAQGPPQAWRYIAGSWQLLGGQFVYNNTVSQPRLAFDGGAAFALFRDDEQDLQPSVMYLGTPLGEAAGLASLGGMLYPNPANDVVHLRLSHVLPACTVRLCDTQGRMLAQWQLGTHAELDFTVDHLPTGHYWLVVQSGDTPPQIGSLVKL